VVEGAKGARHRGEFRHRQGPSGRARRSRR
jgi:hypothetical protein